MKTDVSLPVCRTLMAVIVKKTVSYGARTIGVKYLTAKIFKYFSLRFSFTSASLATQV